MSRISKAKYEMLLAVRDGLVQYGDLYPVSTARAVARWEKSPRTLRDIAGRTSPESRPRGVFEFTLRGRGLYGSGPRRTLQALEDAGLIEYEADDSGAMATVKITEAGRQALA